MKKEKQVGLPFPLPRNSKIWPNGLGFDLGTIEFWNEGGCRDTWDLKWGAGDNWLSAWADLLSNPKDCR
jgi:hypothetical protein